MESQHDEPESNTDLDQRAQDVQQPLRLDVLVGGSERRQHLPQSFGMHG